MQAEVQNTAITRAHHSFKDRLPRTNTRPSTPSPLAVRSLPIPSPTLSARLANRHPSFHLALNLKPSSHSRRPHHHLVLFCRHLPLQAGLGLGENLVHRIPIQGLAVRCMGMKMETGIKTPMECMHPPQDLDQDRVEAQTRPNKAQANY
jgi:hypothetical protein